MTQDRWAGVPDLLSRLEDLELRLLSWGVVDGFLSAAEVDDAIEVQLDLDADRGAALALQRPVPRAPSRRRPAA